MLELPQELSLYNTCLIVFIQLSMMDPHMVLYKDKYGSALVPLKGSFMAPSSLRVQSVTHCISPA